MLEFISANLATILVGAVVLAVVIAVTVSMVKKRGSGGSCSCGCGCGQCAGSAICHPQRDDAKQQQPRIIIAKKDHTVHLENR